MGLFCILRFLFPHLFPHVEFAEMSVSCDDSAISSFYSRRYPQSSRIGLSTSAKQVGSRYTALSV